MARNSRGRIGLAREERVQIMLAPDELKAVDDFRFQHRMPSRAAAIRELLRHGLGAVGAVLENSGVKSGEYSVLKPPRKSGRNETDQVKLKIHNAGLATGAHTVSGRLTLANGYANGHAHEPARLDEPMAARLDESAIRTAMKYVRHVLGDGARPESDVARRLADMGLKHLLHPAADRLGVVTLRGQWRLPG
jgi:metal-responsive CopG/Arc/MetJ family transcriptional regulator